MKKLILIAFVFIVSCKEDNLQFIEQEIIDGKVSAIQEGVPGRSPKCPKIWVQTPTCTKAVEIPFSYEDRWKVGDSCLLIIQRYKEVKTK